MSEEHVRVQDLFPTAESLFSTANRGGRGSRRFVVWVLFGATVALFGYRVRRWLDHRP